MKTYMTYGFVMAVANAAFIVVLYLLGLHSDPTKLKLAQMLGLVGGVTIGAICLSLGIRARRDQVPPTEEFSYGSALGAGVMIGLFAALFGIATTYLYATVINPDFCDVVVRAQMTEMEARGMNATQMEAAEKIIRKMTSPGVQAAFGFVGGFVISFVIALIAAAFLKRPAVLVTNAPPPIA